jgi:hypothetical protein
MATDQRYVDTGSAGGDGSSAATSGASAAFASLSSWEANGPWGLTGADHFTVDCAATDTGSGNVADTAGSVNIDFVAITTGSITIQQSGSARNTSDTFIDETKYRLIINGTCIRPVKNTTIRGMQLDCTSASGFVSAINCTSPGRVDGLTVEYCRIRSAARGCIGYNASNPAAVGTTIIRNNVMVQTSGAAAIDLDSSGTNNSACQIDVYHNTIYSQSTDPCVRILDLSGAAVQTVNVKNNICANSSNPLDLVASTGSLTTTTDYNWTDDGADGTTNEQNLSGTQFTSAGTTFAADFSLTEALATGGAVGSITDDITGTTRGSPPDAGAYEFVSAAANTVTTTLDAAIQRQITVATSLNAAIQTSNTVNTEVTAAIQEARTVATTLDATVQQTRTALVTLDAALLQARTALVTMDAAVQASLTASTTLDAFIQAGFQVQAFVDAAIQQNRTAITSLDAGIQTTRTVTTAIDAAILASLAVTATIDAAIRFTGTATTTIDAAIQQARTAAATIDAVVALALNVTTSLDAAIQSARTAMAWLDAYIDDPAAVPPVGRNFNVSGRGRFIVPARGGLTVH